MLKKVVSESDNKKPFEIPGMGVLRYIKHGPGLVGRTAPIALALVFLFGLAIWSLRSMPYMVLGLVALISLIIAGYFALVFWYGTKYAKFATMDGQELVDYYRIEQAASDNTVVIDLTAEPIPNPALIEHQKGEGNA